jgi:hypothetical protein
MSEPMLFGLESRLAYDTGQTRVVWRFMISGEWWIDWEAVGALALLEPAVNCDPLMVAMSRLLLAGRSALVDVSSERAEELGREAAVRFQEMERAAQQAAPNAMDEAGHGSDQPSQQATPRVLH